jgi:hypothetical protein
VTITDFLPTLDGEGRFAVLNVAAKADEARIGFPESAG